jgi:hypothetical protein
VRFRSLLRRRPDAATWPIARDVSQRVEPDIRPLGHEISTFIAEKTRRLVAEPPELFQLKCPSRTLKGSNTLKQE